MAETQEVPKWDPKKWAVDKSHKPDWYQPTLDAIDEPSREILEKYSRIASDQVIPHVVAIRDKAFDIFPYPCIGLFRFMGMSISKSVAYDEVLQRVKSGEKLLDVGCCFAQDIRKLVVDGAPSENLYGTDLEMPFIELGYDLFLDKETLKTKFYAGDIFDVETEIKELDDKINIVHACSFFHLFDWDQSVLAAKRIVGFLKKETGSLVIGRQLGAEVAGNATSSVDKKTRYRHNVESFKRMWKRVGDETDSQWDVEVAVSKWPGVQKDVFGMAMDPKEITVLSYVVRRL